MTQISAAPLPVSCIVAIGASAGGVGALHEFFSQVESTRLSFVVVQHLEIGGHDLAIEVLRKQAQIPVEKIQEGLAISAGTVYFAPSHTLVSISKGIFSLQEITRSDQRLSTIDHFMTSLADDAQEKSIGIVFSGEGSDGTEGLRSISDAGGMTIVQDPKSTEYPSMPESAIRLAIVDHILPVSAVYAEVASYEKYILRLLDQTQATKMRDEINSALGGICEILHKATGHDFKHYKTNTLVRRIQRRMQILQLVAVDAYFELLQSEPSEIDSLFKELLINVTSFFRDPLAFDELRASVLEKALATHPKHLKYRVWVAGCSTGEEAYTLAMIFRELQGRMQDPPEVQIIATDIDEIALNAARRGSYSASIADDLTPDRLNQFFVRKGGRYVVTKDLREMCLFSSHNIINDPPFSQIDLVTCRNLLIYLGPHLQQKLIPVFHYALRPLGTLFLGTSETLSGHQELFRTISARYRIAQRRSTAIRSTLPISGQTVQSPARMVEPMPSNEVDLNLVAQRIVLDEFSPRYAIINEDVQIVSVSGGINRYLEPSEGLFHNSILKLVRPSLRTALRSSISLAKKHKRKVTNEHSVVELDGQLQRIGVVVQPMPQLGEQNQLFMVVFQYLGVVLKNDDSLQSEVNKHSSMAVEQLERELSLMREDLDKTVQELESSNEELKSSNEELLSMNEELQAANEELETSKEDVQAANEALQRSNTDLENLLAGTNIATLFLDEENRIKSFTPSIQKFYPLIQSDVGREIDNFTARALNMPEYPRRRDLLDDKPLEAEILTPDNKVYLRRINSYRKQEGQLEGLVVTFIDITDLRRSEVRFSSLANLAPTITWIASDSGSIHFLNARWFEFSGASESASYIGGWKDFIHPEDMEGLQLAWERAAEGEGEINRELRLKRADGQYIWFLARGVASRDEKGKIIEWFGTCTDIQAQKVEIDFLKESGDGLRTIIETIPHYIWRTNADGAADYCSESFADFVGRTQEECLGWGWLDVIHSEDLEHVKSEWAKSRAAKQAVQVDFRAIVRGSVFWIRSEGRPYFNSAGELIKYYGTWADITQQVYLEEAKVEALNLYKLENRKFETLFSDAPSAMALFRGKDLIVEKANKTFFDLLGSRLVMGQPYFTSFPEREEGTYRKILQDVFRTGIPFFENEVPVSITREAEGVSTKLYLDVAYICIKDANSNPYGVFVHLNDVTASVKARNALMESEARFRLLADAMPQIVFAADGEGNINYFNYRWREYTGLTFEETKDWNWGPVLHPDDLQRTIDTWTKAVAENSPYEIEYRLKGADGTYRWHLGRAVMVPANVVHETRWFGTNTDIHDAKVLNEQLNVAKLNAESASEIKSRFLANMSHEIRTPLGVIIGFTDLLQEQLEGDQEVEVYVDRIVSNAKQLGALIDDILDLSKVEADRLDAEITEFVLKDAVDDILSSLRVLARERGLVFEELWDGADPGTVRTDPTRFRQILVNIVGNAIKFTDSGTVRVIFATEGKGKKRALVVRVKDSGIGLSEQQKDHIFEPFMQADSSVTRRFGGTGLGLTLSRRLSQVLGGDLVLEDSELGRGSTFAITIAIGAENKVASSAPEAVSGKGQEYPTLSSDIKVLIVDDSPDNRAIVSRFLKLAGADFDTAENGAIAVEKAGAQDYSMILMDIQMPVMDGYQALKKLRGDGYQKPIMALTAHAMKEEKDRCLEAGFNDYLSKPVDRQALLSLIKDLTHS